MATRADFYIGRGEAAEWLGSIAFDGYPEGITPLLEEMERGILGKLRHKDGNWPKGEHLFDSKTIEEFRSRLERFFQYRDDVTRPNDGWPWPWENSNTTDFAYAFDGGKVWASCFGSKWYDPAKEQPEDGELRKVAVFPNMKERQNVVLGIKSGLIVVAMSEGGK